MIDPPISEGFRTIRWRESATHAVCWCYKRIIAKVNDEDHACTWTLLRRVEEEKTDG